MSAVLPRTQSASGQRSNAGPEASDPNFLRKAGPVDPIMHDRLARREQRRASRQNRYDTARRLARVELELTGLSAQVTADSIVLGTASVQQGRRVISAQTRRSDEATCAALAELIWTPAERLAFHAMKADADGEQR